VERPGAFRPWVLQSASLVKAVTVCTQRNLRGLAEKEEGMQPARAGFHKIVADILRHAPVEDAAGIAWGLVCGRTVAGKTEVLEFREGVLRVRVPDETWRSNLAAFVPRYREVLNTMLSQKVENIQFVTPEKISHKKGAA
jgi:Dna[CI] antecedent, DciA